MNNRLRKGNFKINSYNSIDRLFAYAELMNSPGKTILNKLDHLLIQLKKSQINLFL